MFLYIVKLDNTEKFTVEVGIGISLLKRGRQRKKERLASDTPGCWEVLRALNTKQCM